MNISKLKSFIYVTSLMAFSSSLLAQEMTAQSCYRATNPLSLSITTDEDKETGKQSVNEIVRSAMVIYKYNTAGSKSNKADELSFKEGAAISIHAFSRNIYFTSYDIGYNSKEKKFTGDCDAGIVFAELFNNDKLMKLTSDGYRGSALISGACSNASLVFRNSLDLIKMSDSDCEKEVKKLPVLPEEEID